MELDWVRAPQHQNEGVDALTNQEFSGFDPKLCVEVEVEKLAFRSCPKIWWCPRTCATW